MASASCAFEFVVADGVLHGRRRSRLDRQGRPHRCLVTWIVDTDRRRPFENNARSSIVWCVNFLAGLTISTTATASRSRVAQRYFHRRARSRPGNIAGDCGPPEVTMTSTDPNEEQ